MTTKTIQYSFVPEFDKDLKKLQKRYNSLSEDVESMKKHLLDAHYIKAAPLSSNTIVDIQGMCGKNYKVEKIKKFACKSLKNFGNRSGIRIIFILEIKEMKISFIEIYHKSEKDTEDKERIKKYIKSHKLL